jgi:hypothetical protein
MFPMVRGSPLRASSFSAHALEPGDGPSVVLSGGGCCRGAPPPPPPPPQPQALAGAKAATHTARLKMVPSLAARSIVSRRFRADTSASLCKYAANALSVRQPLAASIRRCLRQGRPRAAFCHAVLSKSSNIVFNQLNAIPGR